MPIALGCQIRCFVADKREGTPCVPDIGDPLSRITSEACTEDGSTVPDCVDQGEQNARGICRLPAQASDASKRRSGTIAGRTVLLNAYRTLYCFLGPLCGYHSGFMRTLFFLLQFDNQGKRQVLNSPMKSTNHAAAPRLFSNNEHWISDPLSIFYLLCF